jgi:CheY-like chemotaxis protein
MSPPFPFGRENFEDLARRNHGARRVLLVDDEPESLYLFARMLVNAGIPNQIDVADGGEEAVSYLRRCMADEYPWPAAVFLDIKMPVMDGFGVLEWARDNGVLEHTVVVMLTSSEEPEDAALAFQLGAHYYIPKEARREKLNELLRDVLRRDAQAGTDQAAG